MSKRLEGKIAVVTGGGAGTGMRIVEKLSAEGAGIVVADLNSADDSKAIVEAHGQRFFSARVDVTDADQVNVFATQVRGMLGPVDICEQCGYRATVEFEQVTFEQWFQLFSINVNGYFLVTKAFLEDLKVFRAGRLIYMSSPAIGRARRLSPPTSRLKTRSMALPMA